MNLSFWERESYFNNIDYTIIGSGIVGLSAAIELKKKLPEKKVIVLERGLLPYGASTKNAGFACFGSPSEILDDLQKMSLNEVLSIVEKRWKGLQNLKRLLGEKSLDFLGFGSYELFKESDSELYEECYDKIGFLNDLVKPIFSEKVYFPSDEIIQYFGFKGVSHAIKNKFEGQINTGQMMLSLLRVANQHGIIIINGIDVQKIEHQSSGRGVRIYLKDYDFDSKKVIVATNGFAKQLYPELNVEPARAQVVVTSEIPELKIKGTFHMDHGFYYFRNIGNRILLGGGRNLDLKTENTTEFETTELIQNKLEEILRENILPMQNFEIDMRWVGIMGVGDKKTTIVKPYSENIFLAVRMGGMGVAIGSLIGKEVAELALS